MDFWKYSGNQIFIRPQCLDVDNVRWRPCTSERETGESDIDRQIDRQEGTA